MSSYADIASHGPKQSPEQNSRAPPLPQVEHSDDSTTSLIDVDHPHVSSVPSDFDVQSIQTDTQVRREELEAETEDALNAAASKSKSAKSKAKAKASSAKSRMQENPDEVLQTANLITGAVGVVALGYGAYQKHTKGQLDWKTVGLWGGVAAVVGVADYYAGQYLLKRYKESK